MRYVWLGKEFSFIWEAWGSFASNGFQNLGTLEVYLLSSEALVLSHWPLPGVFKMSEKVASKTKKALLCEMQTFSYPYLVGKQSKTENWIFTVRTWYQDSICHWKTHQLKTICLSFLCISAEALNYDFLSYTSEIKGTRTETQLFTLAK